MRYEQSISGETRGFHVPEEAGWRETVARMVPTPAVWKCPLKWLLLQIALAITIVSL